MDSDAELNEKTKSVMYFVRGASFDKKEFKRNVAGRLLTPRYYGSTIQYVHSCTLIKNHMNESAVLLTKEQFRFLRG